MAKLIDGDTLVNVFDKEDQNDSFNRLVVNIVKDAVNKAPEVDAIPIDWMEKRIEYYKGLNCWYTAKLAILEWRAKQEGRYVPGD
jgi:hypothetical protein